MMNYPEGTTAFCLDSIVQHTDIHSTRERTMKDHKEGKNISEIIKEQKGAILAGKITNMRIHSIRKIVSHLVNTNNTNSKKITIEKGEAVRSDMLAKVAEANEIKVLGKLPESLTIEQLKILLMSLCYHKDKKITTKKGDISIFLVEWEVRETLSVDEKVDIVVDNARSELKECENSESDVEEEPVLQSEEIHTITYGNTKQMRDHQYVH